MYIKCITVVIFSCLCSKVISSGSNTASTVMSYCSVLISGENASRLPVIFTSDDKNAKIIDPDSEGYLKIDSMQSIKLACVKTKFQNDAIKSTEILVTCIENDTWLYQEITYEFFDFICTDTPRSELIVTSEKCQAGKCAVAKVGFQTEKHFLDLYSMCFNESSKNSLYSWYYTKPPYFNTQQKICTTKEYYMTTKELFGQIDIDLKYSFSQQVKSMGKILGSEKQAKYNFKEKSDSYLTPGFLISQGDFFFANQQEATFFYANTAPQWKIINKDIWSIVEETIRKKIRESSTARHLVVSGTYGICTLADVHKSQKPLFLDDVDSIRVPLFFWKLLYNLDQKNGLVYIALNNPFMKIDNDTYICEDVCPGEFSEIPGKKRKLVFCCTIESFVNVYSKLDSILFDGEMASKFLSPTPGKVAELPSWTEPFSKLKDGK